MTETIVGKATLLAVLTRSATGFTTGTDVGTTVVASVIPGIGEA